MASDASPLRGKRKSPGGTHRNPSQKIAGLSIKTFVNGKLSQVSEISWQGRLRIGILGGGQLSKMLVEAALPLGIEPVIFGESADDPAVRLCPFSVTGAFSDEGALGKLFSQVNVVIFENEFVPSQPLENINKKHPNVKILPGIAAMSAVRDKFHQKQLMQRLGIPTAEFVSFPANGDAEAWLDEVTAKLTDDFILKWGSMGYDGKGVMLDPSDRKRAAEFCRAGAARGGIVYAEKKVSFRRELAILGCYSTRGEFDAYPVVVSEQENGICVRVVGPARSAGLSNEQENTAREYARKLAEELKLYGCFAIELFETADGKLLANEMAPRVHNSGHFSQNAAQTSQFENHLRGVLGLPLGSMKTAPSFAMRNLLGPDHSGVSDWDAPLPIPRADSYLHWYGKKDIREGRKVGHLNASSYEAGAVPRLVKELEAIHDEWTKRMKERK